MNGDRQQGNGQNDRSRWIQLWRPLQSVYENMRQYFDFMMSLPFATVRLFSLIPASKSPYKPLDNNQIVLEFTEAQAKWWLREPRRVAFQKQLGDIMTRIESNRETIGKVSAKIADVSKKSKQEQDVLKSQLKGYETKRKHLNSDNKEDHQQEIDEIERKMLETSQSIQDIQNSLETDLQPCNQQLAILQADRRSIIQNVQQNPYIWLTKAKNGNLATELTLGMMVKLYVDEKSFLAVPPNTSLFWAKCDIKDVQSFIDANDFWKTYSPEYVGQITKRNKIDGEASAKTVAKTFKLETLREFTNSVDGDPMQQIWNVASWLMAHEASGTVFMINNDDPLRPKSTWQYIELPELMKNKDVDMIVNVDIKNPGNVKSVCFPNGLWVESLCECTFKIPIEVCDLITDNDQRARFQTLSNDGNITCKSLYESGITSFSAQPFMIKDEIYIKIDKDTGLEIVTDDTNEFDKKKSDIQSYSIDQLIKEGKDNGLTGALKEDFSAKIQQDKHNYYEELDL